jgi:hypothetical protein
MDVTELEKLNGLLDTLQLDVAVNCIGILNLFEHEELYLHYADVIKGNIS